MATVLTVGGLVANVAGTLFKGFAAKRAADEEADDLREQAELQRQEDEEEARRLDKKNKKFLARQSLMFVKGGVTLAGSPMLILEETQEEAAKESTAFRRRGAAKFSFGQRKAERVERAGRGALLGSVFEAAGSGFTGFRQAQKFGAFE